MQIPYQYGTLTLCGWLSQTILVQIYTKKQSYNPESAVTLSVWASAISLATTFAITIVFSS